MIARPTLREFWQKHPDSEQALRAWYHDARMADWRSPTDIKRVYANASIVGENRVVFNIKETSTGLWWRSTIRTTFVTFDSWERTRRTTKWTS